MSKDNKARVGVGFDAEEIALVDEYRRSHPDLPPRAEVVRQMALERLREIRQQAAA